MKRLAALLLTLAAGPALAFCEDTASMVEMKDCLAEIEQAVEIEMALTWTQVQQNIATRYFLQNTQRARFAAAADRAQAAWAAFREADCREVTGFEWWGGSGAGVAIRSCRIETTAARVRNLTARYGLDPSDAPLFHDSAR
jgi:uncharacterized protein YecT (DUF1311 family)